MIRKITAALMLPAFAAILFVGCGEEVDLTASAAEWTEKADAVSAKLDEAQQLHTELMGMQTSSQVADMTDEQKAQHEMMGQKLDAQQSTLQSVSETLASHKEAMTEAMAANDKAKFDEAMAAAKTAYDEALTKLDGSIAEMNAMKDEASMATDATDTVATGDAAAAPAEGDEAKTDAEGGSKEM